MGIRDPSLAKSSAGVLVELEIFMGSSVPVVDDPFQPQHRLQSNHYHFFGSSQFHDLVPLPDLMITFFSEITTNQAKFGLIHGNIYMSLPWPFTVTNKLLCIIRWMRVLYSSQTQTTGGFTHFRNFTTLPRLPTTKIVWLN